MSDLKKSVESILFSVGRKVSLEELSKLCKADASALKKELNYLRAAYDEHDSALMIVEEGDSWKITVREDFLPLVRKIVTETELSKTIMETLAVIAFKAPVKQSDVIRIRTNKAYDHLSELEQAGYITREKHGRTRLIKLSQKFFDYFDIPPDKLKQKFSKFEDIEKAIIEKEDAIEKQKAELKQKKKDAEQEIKEQEAKGKDKNEKLDDMDVYETTPKKEGLGDLEIYNVKKKKSSKKEKKEELELDEDVELEIEEGEGKAEEAEAEETETEETKSEGPLHEEQEEEEEQKPKLEKKKQKNETEDFKERELSKELEEELK